MISKFYLSFLILVLVAYFVAPEDQFVYEYGPHNFRQQIEDMDGNFIMFYTTWCHHCSDFLPVWNNLAELVNTKDSRFGIAQVDCTLHSKLCHDNDITGYPTLLYFHKNSFSPIQYKGTRDLPSLTLFLSEVFNMKTEKLDPDKYEEVKIYSGMAHLKDENFEKFLAKGQHFVMFYAPWCSASQKLAPIWSELAVYYGHHPYIRIGKVNCLESETACSSFDIKQYPYLVWIVNGRIMGISDADTLENLKAYVDRMVLAENHDPEKFMKKKKALPVARITEETFETFLEKDLVFVNFFAPWCAHCMQLSPLWMQLGEKFLNDSRVLIADVDCVRSKPICETEKISGLPTLILYKNKKIVQVEHGGKPLESLVSLVNDHLESKTSNKAASETNEDKTTSTKDEL